MKRRTPQVKLVLPTEAVLTEYRPYQWVLDRLAVHLTERRLADPTFPYQYSYTFESMTQYLVGQWAAHECSPWRGVIYRQLSTYEQVLNYFHADHLGERILSGAPTDLVEHLNAILMTFARDMYAAVIPVLDDFSFSEHQLETLEFADWLGGNSLVLLVLES